MNNLAGPEWLDDPGKLDVLDKSDEPEKLAVLDKLDELVDEASRDPAQMQHQGNGKSNLKAFHKGPCSP